MTRVTAPKRDERGLSQSVQYAAILPVLMLATLGVVQAGVWLHGHDVAIRAANGAADVARGSYGSAVDAKDVASKLATVGGLKDVSVTVTRSAARVDVTVSAEPPLIFDVGLRRIRETASVPVERVTRP